jgi:hypothetical protein
LDGGRTAEVIHITVCGIVPLLLIKPPPVSHCFRILTVKKSKLPANGGPAK